MWYAISLPTLFIGGAASGVGEQALGGLLQLGGIIVFVIGHFSLRSSLEEYFTQVENIHLRLSTGMTFWFNSIYFQYHFNRIRRWKLTGVLS